jgi:phosphopantothenoylcysteine decarboxylase / phosphopantothenate---cysteine ligase
VAKVLRFLITAGPTREYLDSVRYFSNGSSGKMGYACAETAARRGHRVVLVSGPVELATPGGSKRVDVISALQMRDAVLAEFGRCDAVIMTAAVCDYRPKRMQSRKMKKGQGSLFLELQRTPDILAGLGRLKKHQILIGFAVEDRAGKSNARRKLIEKKLDAIVLNTPAAVGADRSDIHLLQAGDRWQPLGNIRKTTLAERLIALAEKLCADSRKS